MDVVGNNRFKALNAGVTRAGGLKEGRLSQWVRGEYSAGELSGKLPSSCVQIQRYESSPPVPRRSNSRLATVGKGMAPDSALGGCRNGTPRSR